MLQHYKPVLSSGEAQSARALSDVEHGVEAALEAVEGTLYGGGAQPYKDWFRYSHTMSLYSSVK